MAESGWTLETLRELRQIDLDWQQRVAEVLAELERVRAEHSRHLLDERDKRYDERAKAQEKAVEAALSAAKEAVATATAALENRLNLLNELRGNVLDRSAFDAYKAQQDERHEQLIHAIGELRTGLAVGPEGLPILQSRVDNSSGEEIGKRMEIDNRRAMWAVIAGVGCLLVGVGGIVITLVFLAATGHLN